MKKHFVLFLFSMLLCSGAAAQDSRSTERWDLHHMQQKRVRHHIDIPAFDGWLPLKCDFHIHTVFSDGSVWPEYRLKEAWEEGLDAISITEHLERYPSRRGIDGDANTSYEIAKPAADRYGVILIRGTEITRSKPDGGHMNALFIEDAEKIRREPTTDAAVREANRQNAFVMLNHPGWVTDSCRLYPNNLEWIENKMLHAIEVFNEREWYPRVLEHCQRYGLTVISNSDIHEVTSEYYDLKAAPRPLTIVLARERSEAAIREALFAGRTIGLFDNQVAGKPELVEKLFRACVSFERRDPVRDGKTLYEISNSSSIPFVLSVAGTGRLAVPAHSSVNYAVPSDVSRLEIEVANAHVGMMECLKTAIELQ